MSFNARIRKIYDHLYANAPVKTPAGIANEFAKVAHSVLYLETKKGNRSAFNLSPRDQRELLSGPTLFVEQIANDVRTAFSAVIAEWGLYEKEQDIRLSDFDIAYCIALLGDTVLSQPDKDLFGDIFEIIRSQFAKEKGGQFFTDPLITQLAMELLEFRPEDGETLIDMCAGTGGFLLAGIERLRNSPLKSNSQYPRDVVHSASPDQFVGYEIDADAAKTANSTIKARLGWKNGDFVKVTDSLKLRTLVKEGSVDCAATNPPFGTKITIKDPEVLKNFELSRTGSRVAGSNARQPIRPQAPDTLFLEQNVKMIKPGTGRVAIVLPYQMLSGPKAKSIREWIILNCAIRAIVDLPAETFQPHTGTKAALVVLVRRSKPLRSLKDAPKDERIFMALPQLIGHDRRGNAIYKRNADGTPSDNLLTDIPLVAEAFGNFRDGKLGKPSLTGFEVKLERLIQTGELNINASYHHYQVQVSRHHKVTVKAADFRYVPLHKLTEKIFCPGRFKRNYVTADTNAVPFLGGSNITEHFLTTEKYLAADDSRVGEFLVEDGWILVTRSGSTGIVSRVPSSWNGYAISEHVIRIVPDESKISGAYIFGILRTEYGKAALRMGIFGSVIDEITPEFVGEIQIPIPIDPKRIMSIVKAIERAEKCRDEALALHKNSLRELNNELSFY